jgi:hypothetical protein
MEVDQGSEESLQQTGNQNVLSARKNTEENFGIA